MTVCVNDTTITRTIRICKNNGYGSIRVYNLNTEEYTHLQEDEILIAWGGKLSRHESDQLITKLQEKHMLHSSRRNRPGLPTRLPNDTRITNY
jgi:hypothetical protein